MNKTYCDRCLRERKVTTTVGTWAEEVGWSSLRLYHEFPSDPETSRVSFDVCPECWAVIGALVTNSPPRLPQGYVPARNPEGTLSRVGKCGVCGNVGVFLPWVADYSMPRKP